MSVVMTRLLILKLINPKFVPRDCLRIQRKRALCFPHREIFTNINESIVKSNAQSDLLLEKLDEASSSPQKLFHLIEINKTILTGPHCARALKYVADNFKNEPDIKRSPQLTLICNTLTRKSRFLSADEVIAVLSTLHNLQISPKTVIMQTFLEHIRSRINFLNFHQIIFLENLLKKITPTPLIQSLLIALPIVASNHVDMQLDTENLRLLVQLFRYAALHHFTTEKLRKISELIRESQTDWKLDHAVTVLWAFVSLSPREIRNHQILMDKAIAELTKNINDFSSDNVIKLMNSLHKNKLFPYSLFKLCIHKAFVENWDLKKFHFLVTIASVHGYTNYKLFKVYSMIAKDNILGRSLQVPIFEVINNLAEVNFAPANISIFWDWFKYEAKEGFNAKMLMEFSLNLLSLGLDTSIFKDSTLFNDDFYKFITNEKESDIQSIKDKLMISSLMIAENLIPAHLRKSWLEQISMEEREMDLDAKLSLQKWVHFAFKNDFHICNSVLATFGIFIDHLLISKVDLPSFKESELGILKDGQIKHLKNFPSNILKIAIILPTSADYAVDSLRLTRNPALASRVLKHNGFKVSQIVYSDWKQLLEKETVSYLKRAVSESLSEK